MTSSDFETIIKRVVLELNTPNTTTLNQWIEVYLGILNNRNYCKQTLKNKYGSIKHLQKYLGEKSLSSIKPIDISKILLNFSPQSASRILGVLKDIYYEAIINNATDNNPVIHIKPPHITCFRKRLDIDTYLSILEEAYEYSIPWIPAMLMLALLTGQRRSDLAKMRFDDIVDNHLRVEQQKKAGKSIGARVAIPLHTNSKILGCSLETVINFCKSGTPGPTLLRKANGSSLEVSSLSARFRELIMKVTPDNTYEQYEWPSLHEVRSLSARTYAENGVNKEAIQTLLGHKHSEMTNMYLDDRGLTELVYKPFSIL